MKKFLLMALSLTASAMAMDLTQRDGQNPDLSRLSEAAPTTLLRRTVPKAPKDGKEIHFPTAVLVPTGASLTLTTEDMRGVGPNDPAFKYFLDLKKFLRKFQGAKVGKIHLNARILPLPPEVLTSFLKHFSNLQQLSINSETFSRVEHHNAALAPLIKRLNKRITMLSLPVHSETITQINKQKNLIDLKLFALNRYFSDKINFNTKLRHSLQSLCLNFNEGFTTSKEIGFLKNLKELSFSAKCPLLKSSDFLATLEKLPASLGKLLLNTNVLWSPDIDLVKFYKQFTQGQIQYQSFLEALKPEEKEKSPFERMVGVFSQIILENPESFKSFLNSQDQNLLTEICLPYQEKLENNGAHNPEQSVVQKVRNFLSPYSEKLNNSSYQEDLHKAAAFLEFLTEMKRKMEMEMKRKMEMEMEMEMEKLFKELPEFMDTRRGI